jgi:hypothetical protein
MGKRRVHDAEGPPPASPADVAMVDVAMVIDRTEDAQGYRVLRHRDNHVEIGTMRPLQEGRPIDGEVISLEPRQDAPFLYNVKTELGDPHAARRATERRLTSDGPAQIATEQYRAGWDAIWGRTGADKPN